MENKVQDLMGVSIDKIRQMVDVSTVIGDPMTLDDGTTLIPVSRVSYGFATGGSDLPTKGTQELFGGGGGAGVTITPVAFLIVKNGEVSVKYIAADDNAAERIVNLVPEMFDKVTGVIDKRKAASAE